jgi:hypothetical protein
MHSGLSVPYCSHPRQIFLFPCPKSGLCASWRHWQFNVVNGISPSSLICIKWAVIVGCSVVFKIEEISLRKPDEISEIEWKKISRLFIRNKSGDFDMKRQSSDIVSSNVRIVDLIRIVTLIVSGVQQVLTSRPISINISNIKNIFILSDKISPIHHNTKTKTKTYSSNALNIVNLSVALPLCVATQSCTKSNRDSLSNISLSRDAGAKRSPLSYRQPSRILLCLAQLPKHGSESSQMAIDSVLTIRVRDDSSQYSDQSCGSSLIGIHFQAPELYQDTFPFLCQLWKKSWAESWE